MEARPVSPNAVVWYKEGRLSIAQVRISCGVAVERRSLAAWMFSGVGSNDEVDDDDEEEDEEDAEGGDAIFRFFWCDERSDRGTKGGRWRYGGSGGRGGRVSRFW